MATSDYETVLRAARHLTSEEQQRLREELARPTAPSPQPKRSLRGALADLAPAPSLEDIDEVRREMWANFPRDEI